MRTLTDDEVTRWARTHADARAGVYPIDPPSLTHPDMTIADGYAIQSAWVDLDLAAGRRVVGHKVGLTSRAMQQMMQIGEPDYGVLLDDMVFDDGVELARDRFIDPRIEVEVAFVLGRTLDSPTTSMFDALDATAYVVPAIELIDARSHRVDPATKRPRTVRDTVSDNAANAGIITGGRPCRPLDVDLRWIGAILSHNGVIEETGLAAGVLNHPANAVAWLARTFARVGVPLEAGEVILAGSFTRALPAHAGSTFHVDFGPMGSVSCHFT